MFDCEFTKIEYRYIKTHDTQNTVTRTSPGYGHLSYVTVALIGI